MAGCQLNTSRIKTRITATASQGCPDKTMWQTGVQGLTDKGFMGNMTRVYREMTYHGLGERQSWGRGQAPCKGADSGGTSKRNGLRDVRKKIVRVEGLPAKLSPRG